MPYENDVEPGRKLYLDLIEKALIGTIYEDVSKDHFSGGGYKSENRAEGKDWPSQAHSMIGHKRMHSLRLLCEDTLRRGVPGDFIETGVWRGGACILMRAVLKAYGISNRKVWVADSFEGLPPPDAANFPVDAGDIHSTFEDLRVSLETVQGNFAKYDLLDDQVQFLKGWFKDTLHRAPFDSLAVVRLDGDMYESTIQAFDALYHRLSPGGFLIVDDYGAIPSCKAAVHDFRKAHGIDAEIHTIDWTGIYWQKA